MRLRELVSTEASQAPPAVGFVWLPRWLRERRWLLDLLLAGAVFLYNFPMFPAYAGGPVQLIALLVVSCVLCGAFLWRRRHPVAVLAAMLLAATAQILLGAPLLAADVMLWFAVYNLATRAVWSVSLTGAALTVAWLAAAVLPGLGRNFINLGQFLLFVVLAVWMWTWGRLVRTRRQYIAGLTERAEQAERERETNARIAVANERARIAREIHDIVSHSLSVVVVLSDGAAAKVEAEPERAKTAMLQVRDTGRSALSEMRRMLDVLREDEPGSHTPQPGLGQLGALVEQSSGLGMPVSLRVDGPSVPVPESVELTVYRLAQEALTNVRRHAGPEVTRVEVLLRHRPGGIELRVADDGRGLGGTEEVGTGRGLLGMRERVAAHGGTLTAGPRADAGFEVHAWLPTGDRA